MKNNSSKTVYKVYEIFCICRDVFFEEYVENKPGYCMAEINRDTVWQNVQMLGMVSLKISTNPEKGIR